MKRLSRRSLLASMGALPAVHLGLRQREQVPSSVEEFLSGMAWSREVIDEFLDPEEPNWATFDSEIGYRHSNAVMKDGIDDSFCIYRMEPTGERKKIHFAGQACRINTYGDSFTHCDQVSDGETWQEYLAAHFGEPIRNFGTGGYGVYQAYRRMVREEGTGSSTPFVLFNVWIDDHRRSLMSARWLHIAFFRELIERREATHYFHANPWCHVRFNLNNGQLLEFENSHSDPQSLYRFCDPEYMVETYRDDLYVHLEYAIRGGRPGKLDELSRLAEIAGMKERWQSSADLPERANELFWISGMKASERIVHMAQSFAAEHEKNLLFLVSYRSSDVAGACLERPRIDRPFIDFLTKEEVPYIDSLQKHREDFQHFNLPVNQYVRRYYNGHYAPSGNHFFAFAIKDELVQWLDPKPFTYSKGRPSVSDISAFLAR